MMPSIIPRLRATVAGLVVLAACGCEASRSPNEANVKGPPVDPKTIPASREEAVERQKQDVDAFLKAEKARGR